MSSWGGMNFAQAKLIPPSFSSSLDVVLSFTDPLDVVLSLSEPPGCFFRAAAGGAATGRSGAAAFGGDAPIAARGATVVVGAAGLVSGFGTGGGAISEEGIGIVLDRLRYPVGIVRVGIGLFLLRSGVAADAALVALVMADMALPRSIDQTQPSYLVV
eukprot:CAMPEP_0201879072 /NCGR_PEP_ID=MMETSP0902-20130614/10047_1 /ASSEMBLY_ACC=CAM_ASM_000551 /TAXON_ID=420261 /ORGANISM="Thalassiosira antarctica, Strain CCMP982" /LENGTH=157 /DNA_ID=CAMNT_0048406819 /DNA_START=192 /DNA_END=668 /DNA_ORIENTATION=-